MANLNLVVLKSRQNSRKKIPVLISVTHNRDVRYIKTDYEIDDLFQFDKGKVICRKDAKIMNQRLNFILSDYQSKLDNISNKRIYSCSQLKEMLESDKKEETLITIKEYIEDRMHRLEKEGRESYAKMNKYTLDVILPIIGNITLQSITPYTIDKLIRGMSRLSNATQQMRLTHLKAAINEAIKEGLVKYEDHPFKFTKMPKPGVRLLDITIDDFIKIRDGEFVGKKINFGKDLFLLSFYLGGINLADLVDINFNGNTIKYIRKKTSIKKQGEKTIMFEIPKEARVLINKYITKKGTLDFGYKFSYSNLQRYINYCLKTLKKEAGIKSEFTYYSARKTFSQFAFDLGIKTEIIEYCIGQSMKENRPIYSYVRVMQRQADAAIRKVIDYTNNPDKYKLEDIE